MFAMVSGRYLFVWMTINDEADILTTPTLNFPFSISLFNKPRLSEVTDVSKLVSLVCWMAGGSLSFIEALRQCFGNADRPNTISARPVPWTHS